MKLHGTVIVLSTLLASLDALAAEGQIYFRGTAGAIERMNFDGTDRRVVVAAQPGAIIGDPMVIGDEILFTKRLDGEDRTSILKAPKDGFTVNPQEVVRPSRMFGGLALDPINRKVYWPGTLDRHFRADIDGQNQNIEVVPLPESADVIAVDGRNGKIYFSDPFLASIQRANLDGSNLEDVVTLTLEPVATASRSIDGIVVDPVSQTICWDGVRLFGEQVVQCADGTGLNQDVRYIVDVESFYDVLALDISSRRVYFHDHDILAVLRADIDGMEPNVEVVFPDDITGFHRHTFGFDFEPAPHDVCDEGPVYRTQFDQLLDDFGLDESFGPEGLPIRASLALIEEATCTYPNESFSVAANNAYSINLDRFDLEPDALQLLDFREGIAAAMLVSVEGQTFLRDRLADNNVFLTGDYVSVECADDTCTPAKIAGMSLEEGFEVFASGVKTIDEPFSGAGDFDGDGVSNATEFTNVSARGGGVNDFAVVAMDPARDGSEFVAVGGGGGGGCFIASVAYGTPLANDIGILRSFRDRQLLTTSLGAAITDVYYRVGPGLADRIAGSGFTADVVRTAIASTVMAVQYRNALMLFGLLLAAALGMLHLVRKRSIPAYRPTQD